MVLTRSMEKRRKEVFPFLDLPLELRLMIYEQLMDRDITLRLSKPFFEILSVRVAYMFEMFYAHVFRINKQINSEYSALAFRHTCLSITYAIEHDEGDILGRAFGFPRISEAVDIPISALEKIRYLVIEYELEGELPNPNPVRGLSKRLIEMPKLDDFLFRTNINSHFVDPTIGNDVWRDSLFEDFVGNLDKMVIEVADYMDDNEVDFDITVECLLCCPLYSLHSNTWGIVKDVPPKPGQIPASGLPPFGYSKFKVHGDLLTTEEDEDQEAFIWHGQYLTFDQVELDVPFMNFSNRLGYEDDSDDFTESVERE